LVGVATLVGVLSRGEPARADPSDPWWGPDKALHFGASAAIAGGGYAVAAPFVDGFAERVAIGAGLALTVGVSKELIDLAGHGDASFRDLTWDVIGTLVGVGLALSIDLAVRGTQPSQSP
jgi:putative lipoprotein